MRCADGHHGGTKSMRRCVYRKQVDLETLVCTRGTNFPLSRLESHGLWIPVLTNAMIFARRMLPMMSFSIFKARL
jgi:hypothetical protein